MRAGLAAHGDEHVGVILEPPRGGGAVLLARMEITTEVFAPALVVLAHDAALAEQVRSRRLPRAPFPQRAVAAQVVDGLAQRVAQEDPGDALHPLHAPLMAAAQGDVDVEGDA